MIRGSMKLITYGLFMLQNQYYDGKYIRYCTILYDNIRYIL